MNGAWCKVAHFGRGASLVTQSGRFDSVSPTKEMNGAGPPATNFVRSIMQRFKMQVRCDDCGKDISDINYPLMQDDKTDRLLALCPDCVKIRRGEKKDE